MKIIARGEEGAAHFPSGTRGFPSCFPFSTTGKVTRVAVKPTGIEASSIDIPRLPLKHKKGAKSGPL